jgi:WXG100 family type VII secretion target
MTAVALQRNKTYFEQLVGSMPSEVQGFVKGILSPFEELLEMVSGDPDDLIRGAERCMAVAEQVRAIATSQVSDRGTLAQAWSGEAATAFQESMASVEEAIEELAQGLDGAKQILVDAANAAVDAFNLLLELIAEFIIWMLAEFIIAAAASVVSFGASIAAWATRTLARVAVTLGRGARIVAKCAEVLMRLATKLDDVARLLDKYRKMILALRQAKKAYSPLKRAGWTKEALSFKINQFKLMFPAKLAINYVSPVNVPGFAGAASDAVVGVIDVADGKKDRNYVMDGTYREDLAQHGVTVQHLIDLIN